MSQDEMIEALVALSQQALVGVVATALARRTAEVSRPEWEEARLCLAQAHRFMKGRNSLVPGSCCYWRPREALTNQPPVNMGHPKRDSIVAIP
jgi:hypothetical protein